ncbi:MAG: lipoate--protein ligase family protein [Simkania negevensis]|nr:lipoate--protein ligase family protein [Simkania negevensis]
MDKPKLHLLHLRSHPIYEQLKIEELLLRTDERNWCIFNEGSPPAIVMGISGKVEELINLEKNSFSLLPVIKRFSGGGTVVVDFDTLFVSFIFQKKHYPLPLYPEPILRWSEEFYQKAFAIPTFQLKENDYVIGNQKCGGNAQYIRKSSFVHHTTFLWDFQKKQMDLLLHPPKAPSYRKGRSHEEFLCRLKEYLPSQEHFFSLLKAALSKNYQIEEIPLESILPLMERPHRKTTSTLF